tara:strand:- start:83255 stop:84811 length:1557 start_codon:yes stop_codon:yes gene_type:complete
MTTTNKYLLVLTTLISMLISGCKVEAENSTTVPATITNPSEPKSDDLSSCDDNSSAVSSSEKCKTFPEMTVALGEVPIVLTQSPRFKLTTTPYPHHQIQVEIKNSLDNSIVTPWQIWGGSVVSNLTLSLNQHYYANFRFIDAKGKTGKSTSSASWTPRVGIGSWQKMSTINAPSKRNYHSMVWTGSKVIVWGGQHENTGATNTGAVYDPTTDSWTPTSTIKAPTARTAHTAIWTGSEMIVWGGGWQRTGARYNPSTNTWTSMTNVNAPIGCVFHTAIWTGSKMIVWGGEVDLPNSSAPATTNSGAAYDPSNDTWTAISTTAAPSERTQHAAVWTGSKMIIWGGGSYNHDTYTGNINGGVYDVSTNSWSTVSNIGAPGQQNFAGVNNGASWDGSNLLVHDNERYSIGGGKYNLANDQWSRISKTSNPWDESEMNSLPATGFAFSSTVWIGSSWFVWGGRAAWGVTNTGGIYNPTTDTWAATTNTNAPTPSMNARAIWTGSKVIIWGGHEKDYVYAIYTP